MSSREFMGFRLVGGTALSLKLGHRISVDIDLFSDVTYGGINFTAINNFVENTFAFSNHLSALSPALGKSYSVGKSEESSVKLDVYYTDPFIRPVLVEDDIRMVAIEEIVAMKIDVVQRGGRKKDFWDLHELLDTFSISSMLALHEERYPYNHDEGAILKNFTTFTLADEDFDPICLRGKFWQFIKDDIARAVQTYLTENAG